jgi:transposase InsO family protein
MNLSEVASSDICSVEPDLNHYRVKLWSADGVPVSLHRFKDEATANRVAGEVADAVRSWASSNDTKPSPFDRADNLFRPGVRVETCGGLRPTYVLGLPGTVRSFPTETKHRRVKVEIDADAVEANPKVKRFLDANNRISVPAVCLKVVA